MKATGGWVYGPATRESCQYRGKLVKGYGFGKGGLEVFVSANEYAQADGILGYVYGLILNESVIGDSGKKWQVMYSEQFKTIEAIPKSDPFGFRKEGEIYGNASLSPEKCYGTGSYPYGGPYASQGELEDLLWLRDNFPGLPIPEYVAKDMHRCFSKAIESLVFAKSIKVVRLPKFMDAAMLDPSGIKISSN
ncbi:hypothetical protein HYU11_00305 [Candidatus Woesearchaeota archaeon]|nr:hypothetical protein [Candidatus Woesearchaeota archaeon]